MHPQTLRIYENKGLIRPKRGRQRAFVLGSRHQRLQLIQQLTNDLGLNPRRRRGRCCSCRTRWSGWSRQLDRMQREMRAAIDAVHRQYRRDLVPWKPPIDLASTPS